MSTLKRRTHVAVGISLTMLTLTAGASCDRSRDRPVDHVEGAADSNAGPTPFLSSPSRTGAAPAGMPSEVAPQAMRAKGMALVSRGIDVALPATRPQPSTAATIVRNGIATVQVDSLEGAMAGLESMVRSLGGWVGNASMSTGSDQVRSASLELKLPAARYDEAIHGLSRIGRVEAATTTEEDVGEELVDVEARIANARRLEERLVELLRTRTGKLEDALAVERELARVREEVERHEGRLRFLRARTTVSTLTVAMHEPLPLVGAHPGDSPIRDAFRDAWRNFIALTTWGIASLGILAPIALITFAAWRVVRHLRRRLAATMVAASNG